VKPDPDAGNVVAAIAQVEQPASETIGMEGFTRVIWLSREEVDGLKSKQTEHIPITVLGFDSTQRRIQGSIETESAELAFLP
jgi:hypothetical protein